MYDKAEQLILAATLPGIKYTLVTQGIDCKLFKPKVKSEHDDTYGTHGGSSTDYDIYGSVEPEPVFVDLTAPKPVAELPDEDNLGEPSDVRITLSKFHWRCMKEGMTGYYEDGGYVYAQSTTPVESGDLIMLERDGIKARFYVVSPETIGITTPIVTRFLISNVG